MWHNETFPGRKTTIVDIPYETWYAAIFERHSRRTYSPEPVDKETLARLADVCRSFRPFPGARAELVLGAPQRVFRGLVGRYGRVNGAIYYIAFVGDAASPQFQEATGFMGEGIILEATALGLATCWVAGFFRPDAVKDDVPLGVNERVLGITPVGHAGPQKYISERLLSSMVRSRHRKDLDKLIRGGEPAGWTGKALEAARLAPSARNRQPWRFTVEDRAIIVSEDQRPSPSSISKRLDCGIAMLHLELGARAAGRTGRWELLASPRVARFAADL
jgi:nitroreductase